MQQSKVAKDTSQQNIVENKQKIQILFGFNNSINLKGNKNKI